MNELIGIKKTEEKEPETIHKVSHKEPEPVVPSPHEPIQEPKPVAPYPEPVVQSPPLEPKKETIPTPVQPMNPIISFLQGPENDVLRIEKIESNPTTVGLDEETDEEMETQQEEYVLFRIYSPYYEIYKTLFTTEYFKSIGFTVIENNNMLGGGEEEPTFPYSLFKALFNNTIGRFSSLFQPKKESLAEETLKKTDKLLSSVSNFKTEELLKPQETQIQNTEEKNPVGNTLSPSPPQPPYYEIKLLKTGPVLTQKEYNEKKMRETNDEILEHDENGKTFQEILLETKQSEIQKARKQSLLSILDVSLQSNTTGKTMDDDETIVEKIKRLEKQNASNEKVWFIRQQIVLEDDNYATSILLQEPIYKWILLDLALI